VSDDGAELPEAPMGVAGAQVPVAFCLVVSGDGAELPENPAARRAA
jgi:hypothetical protein